MMRTHPWFVTLAVAGAVAALLFVAQPARLLGDEPSSQSADAGYKPVIPREVLMEWQEHAFSGMNRAIVQKKGDAARENAWLIAELANVNQLFSDKQDYDNWAIELRDAAAKVAQAAKDGDFEQGKVLARQMLKTCNACHAVYRPEP